MSVERLTYSIEEAAEATGIGRDTLRTLVRHRQTPHVRYGRGARIPIDSLKTWLMKEAEREVTDA